MASVCEITRKRVPHFSNLPEDNRPDVKAYRRVLLKRKVKVPEVQGSVNLWVTEEGLKQVKEAGGLAKFLKDRDDKKLTPKLLKLKRKIHGEPKPEKPAEAAGEGAKEAKAETGGEAEAAKSEAKEEKPEAKEEKAESKEEKPEAKEEKSES